MLWVSAAFTSASAAAHAHAGHGDAEGQEEATDGKGDHSDVLEQQLSPMLFQQVRKLKKY